MAEGGERSPVSTRAQDCCPCSSAEAVQATWRRIDLAERSSEMPSEREKAGAAVYARRQVQPRQPGVHGCQRRQLEMRTAAETHLLADPAFGLRVVDERNLFAEIGPDGTRYSARGSIALEPASDPRARWHRFQL